MTTTIKGKHGAFRLDAFASLAQDWIQTECTQAAMPKRSANPRPRKRLTFGQRSGMRPALVAGYPSPCTQCGNRVWSRTVDMDWSCPICGTVKYVS